MADGKFDQQFFQQAFLLVRRQILRLQNGADIILYIQATEDRSFLWQVANACARATVHRQVADIQVVDQYAALVSLNQALGAGWQERGASPQLQDETIETMRQRTDWGGLLDDYPAATETTGASSDSP